MKKTTLSILATVIAVGAGAGIVTAQEGPRRGGPDGERPTFEQLDVDGSGEITTEDMEALRANRFAEIDTNGDGSVSAEEFAAHAEDRAAERAAEMFARLDADGDGMLSRDVLESRGRGDGGSRMISRADTDNSGGVSAEEFEAAQERMAEMRGKRGEGRGGKDRGGEGRGKH